GAVRENVAGARIGGDEVEAGDLLTGLDGNRDGPGSRRAHAVIVTSPRHECHPAACTDACLTTIFEQRPAEEFLAHAARRPPVSRCQRTGASAPPGTTDLRVVGKRGIREPPLWRHHGFAGRTAPGTAAGCRRRAAVS